MPAIDALPLAHPALALATLCLYVLLGAICGVADALFIKALHFAEDAFEKLPGRYTRHVVGMLRVGGLIYGLHEKFGHYFVEEVGYSTIQAILNGWGAAGWLLSCPLSRESGALFRSAAADGAAETMPASTQAGATPAVATTGSGGVTSQDHKLAFVNGNIDRGTTSPDRVQPPASQYVLQAGAVIPASLITGLRSDLPGEVTAQVTEDVYDTPTGKILLIPQGARLVGQYDAQISFGQTRALLVWNRLIMPNGKSIVLERQPGADTQGYAGLEDEVDNHWGMLFKAAILSTLLSVGSEAGTSNSENNLAQAIRQGASQSFNQAGEQVVGRSLNIQPTITIRPGFPVRVLVTHDLVLEPYGA